MQRLRKGDEVIITTGKDRGGRGKVSSIMVKKGKLKVIVDGLNMAKKHVKPNPQANEPGGIVSKEMPLDASNVMLYNTKTQKGDRVGFKIEKGKKVRVFKSSGEVLE